MLGSGARALELAETGVVYAKNYPFFIGQNKAVLRLGSWLLENISVSEAGRKGGLALLSKRGKKHFAEIGKKGQEIMKERFPDMASAWGKKGGRPRKNNI